MTKRKAKIPGPAKMTQEDANAHYLKHPHGRLRGGIISTVHVLSDGSIHINMNAEKLSLKAQEKRLSLFQVIPQLKHIVNE